MTGEIVNYEHSEPFDPNLKEEILHIIDRKMSEIREHGFNPAFVVLNRRAYSSLVAYIIKLNSDGKYVFGINIDGTFPTTIFGIHIVLLNDSESDVMVLADSKHEYQHKVYRKG